MPVDDPAVEGEVLSYGDPRGVGLRAADPAWLSPIPTRKPASRDERKRGGADTVGSSYTDYRGHGFWASDATVEQWLLLLLDDIRSRPAVEQWLTQACDDWTIQATAGFQGCVDVGLERHLIRDTHREAAFAAILNRIDGRLATANPLPDTVVDPDDPRRAVFVARERQFLRQFTTAVTGLVHGDPAAGADNDATWR
jgi:hypothetical protein